MTLTGGREVVRRTSCITTVATLVLVVAATVLLADAGFSKGVSIITKEELLTLLDSPSLMIIDVRHEKHWSGTDLKIKGAVREDPNDVYSWVDKYPKDKLLVVYCACA